MKKCLFKLVTLAVVFGLVFSVTACPNKAEEKNSVVVKEAKVNIPFDRLEEVGFKPESIQLPESFVNDKVISETKQLYYDFYYSRDMKKANLFNEANIVHQANVKEDEVGKDSKANVDYSKLKKANGGCDICIGTKFLFGVTVIDQSGVLRHKSILEVTVYAPNRIESKSSNTVSIKGDHTSIDKSEITVDGNGSITISKVELTNEGYTQYTLGSGSGKVIALDFGAFGKTNKVLVKQ